MEHSGPKPSVQFIESKTVTASSFGSPSWMLPPRCNCGMPIGGDHNALSTFPINRKSPPTDQQHMHASQEPDPLHRWTPPPDNHTSKDEITGWSGASAWEGIPIGGLLTSVTPYMEQCRATAVATGGHCFQGQLKQSKMPHQHVQHSALAWWIMWMGIAPVQQCGNGITCP
ncbi:hypothetical protein J3A83DRAFT_4188907 [Scleroderma citrinum]